MPQGKGSKRTRWGRGKAKERFGSELETGFILMLGSAGVGVVLWRINYIQNSSHPTTRRQAFCLPCWSVISSPAQFPSEGASVSCQQPTTTQAVGWPHRLGKTLSGVLSGSTTCSTGFWKSLKHPNIYGCGGVLWRTEERVGFHFWVRWWSNTLNWFLQNRGQNHMSEHETVWSPPPQLCATSRERIWFPQDLEWNFHCQQPS